MFVVKQNFLLLSHPAWTLLVGWPSLAFLHQLAVSCLLWLCYPLRPQNPLQASGRCHGPGLGVTCFAAFTLCSTWHGHKELQVSLGNRLAVHPDQNKGVCLFFGHAGNQTRGLAG
jgi:hypothetical protein